jgi:alpha-mannosidase
MTMTTAHIVNHTHWDREWFLTSVYTSRWIPVLIDNLERLVAANPDFRFLFDGQTLVVEDLLQVAPAYEPRIRELVGNGRLQIGPYYCQPDWQITGGELLLRNLAFGQKDLVRFGGRMNTGWMVDTFGHISQSPQIHKLFGINDLYVWRGVPELEPYFKWQGADGAQLLTINLFGGYRNLYGVSHVPEVAVKRLEAEVDKLRPFYSTADIPLFDGYDLEDNPEDPLGFYEKLGGIRPDIQLWESTPGAFAAQIAAKDLLLPTIEGELNSGKYGATFPGVFSARTYLKIMASDCERMLFKVCEPLGVMAHKCGQAYAVEQYEQWGRILLQNAVHDCICGVSIDQVHEKMEYSYRQAFAGMIGNAQASLAAILAHFAAGSYAVSTNPFTLDTWQIAGDELVHIQTKGVGVWPVVERMPIVGTQMVTDLFVWSNEHYEATVTAEGLVNVGDAVLGEIVVSTEHGDTYSDELGDRLGALQILSGLTLQQSSEHHALLSFAAQWQDDAKQVSAEVRLLFDESPLIKWQIDLDSRGTDLRVEMVFQTAVSGTIKAGMPFDNVIRSQVDDDLLPRKLPADLASVLLGQRELNSVTMFPFQDYVSVSDGDTAVTMLAKGLRGYRGEADGLIIMPLRRAVQWLTAANLQNRDGDAGPFFYVPDARCERRVRHELAVAFRLDDVDSPAFQAANAAYQNPPLIVNSQALGQRTSWQLLQEEVPLSALFVQDGALLARFYNLAPQKRPLARPYTTSDVWGQPAGSATEISAKQILNVRLDGEFDAQAAPEDSDRTVLDFSLPDWRVGENQGRPDAAIMLQLTVKVEALQAEIIRLEAEMAGVAEQEQLRIQHRIYILQRESLEFQLSHLLNERKLEQDGLLNEDYLYNPDAEIAELGLALNHLRIKRRIFDYVVEVL